MRTFATLISLTGLLGFVACDKKEEPPEAKPTATKAADAKAADAEAADAEVAVAEAADPEAGAAEAGAAEAGDAPTAEGSTLSLDDLGLVATTTAEASVGEAVVSSGVMVQGEDLVVTVEEAADDHPKTVEDAKKEVDRLGPQKLETEALDDGWTVVFFNEGPMGTNYFVQVRRELGDTSYWCESTASTPEQQTNALAFCKSLRTK